MRSETMRKEIRRAVVCAIATALVVGVGSLVTAPAFAKKSKSVQTEAKWVSFDAEAKTITVKVKKPGRGNKDKTLRKNKEAQFNVKPEGSVLTKTTVSVNGKRGELTEIPPGKTVNIYWVPDEKDDAKRFARKIDVIFSEEELKERYGFDE